MGLGAAVPLDPSGHPRMVAAKKKDLPTVPG